MLNYSQHPVICQWPLTLDRSAILLSVTRFLLQLVLMITLCQQLVAEEWLYSNWSELPDRLLLPSKWLVPVITSLFSAPSSTAYPDSDSQLQGEHTFPVYPQE